jgi:hypothetical protein
MLLLSQKSCSHFDEMLLPKDVLTKWRIFFLTGRILSGEPAGKFKMELATLVIAVFLGDGAHLLVKCRGS